MKDKQKSWLGIFTHSPSGVLYSAVQMMTMLVDHLKHLKRITDQYSELFTSEGFCSFFMMIQRELSDDYFTIVDDHLKQLGFRNGVLLSLCLGPGNENTSHVLRLPNKKK
ncbi:MAG: DNA mismatch repair protein MutS, partial [Bacillota bacterium]